MTQIIKPWCDVIVQLMARTYTQILAFSHHHQEHAQKQIFGNAWKDKVFASYPTRFEASGPSEW